MNTTELDWNQDFMSKLEQNKVKSTAIQLCLFFLIQLKNT